MQEVDIPYLCTTIGNLSGVPVRIFQDGEQTFYHAQTHLPRDPMVVYRDRIFAVEANVGYVITPHFHYYGIVNSGSTKIVIGPTRQIEESAQELRNLAFRAGVTTSEVDDFVMGMKSIVRMPFESILQMLCTLNHVLNGEKLTLKDITIYDEDQKKLLEREGKRIADKKLSAATDTSYAPHNTIDLEQSLLRIVTQGDTEALDEWMERAGAVRGGVLASEQLRQVKNTFIVATALISRAAIRGGLNPEEAFSYSDSYIQQCELIYKPEDILNLQYRMALDYTERVGRLRLGDNPTKLTMYIVNYIQLHMSEPITVENIADELYLNRSYLSRKFKQETGMTLTAYIMEERIKEAKRLLSYSDRSVSAIGAFLGFSSASHFSRAFKNQTGYTPQEYRAQRG